MCCWGMGERASASHLKDWICLLIRKIKDLRIHRRSFLLQKGWEFYFLGMTFHGRVDRTLGQRQDFGAEQGHVFDDHALNGNPAIALITGYRSVVLNTQSIHAARKAQSDFVAHQLDKALDDGRQDFLVDVNLSVSFHFMLRWLSSCQRNR